MELVEASAKMNDCELTVKTAVVDWKESESWPEAGAADLILGADVLYHGEGHEPLANLLKHLLSASPGDGDLPRFALMVEPMHEERVTATDGQKFAEVAKGVGLDVHVSSLEGPRAMQQIIVTTGPV